MLKHLKDSHLISVLGRTRISFSANRVKEMRERNSGVWHSFLQHVICHFSLTVPDGSCFKEISELYGFLCTCALLLRWMVNHHSLSTHNYQQTSLSYTFSDFYFSSGE